MMWAEWAPGTEAVFVLSVIFVVVLIAGLIWELYR